jgi:hypothetical protein
MIERMSIHGIYRAVLRDKHGKILMQDTFPNVVTTVGKNALFNSGLVTSAVALVGPYMGLISSVSYSAVSAADTMASHAGWREADSTNAPAYTPTNRQTAVFGAPSAGATAITPLVFTFTASGTVEGAFINFAAAATNVWEATTGTLLSAGVFSGGAQAVVSTNTLTVSYSIAM